MNHRFVAFLAVIALALLLATPGASHAQGGAHVSGSVWLDRDGDGYRSEGEPLLDGVIVYAQRLHDTAAPYTLYVSKGVYTLSNALTGSYTMQARLEDGGRVVLTSTPQTATISPEQSAVIDFPMSLPPTRQDDRYFAETGYRVDNDLIWEYFRARGGVQTFGYPVSRTFPLNSGEWVQIFQRHVLKASGGQARPMNLLDPGLIPTTRHNGATFPAYDGAVAALAPTPETANYGDAVRRHLEAVVPNQWDGEPVNFLNSYLAAAPDSPPHLRTLVALEVWGFPTSQPRRDPNNNFFIYQRFQRGIMHYDGLTGATGGILLGDGFKQVITGELLPPDMAEEMRASTFFRAYEPAAVNSLSLRANQPGSILSAPANLSFAFR